MRVIKSYDYLDHDLAEPGRYAITTVNGTVYWISVAADGRAHVVRSREQVPRDPENGMDSFRLYGDGEEIPLLGWRAFRDNRGALFTFYAEDARRTERVEDYAGTIRHTSAVVAIERLVSES